MTMPRDYSRGALLNSACLPEYTQPTDLSAARLTGLPLPPIVRLLFNFAGCMGYTGFSGLAGCSDPAGRAADSCAGIDGLNVTRLNFGSIGPRVFTMDTLCAD